VPSPRQNVLDDALVPLFICDVEMFPERLLKDGCATCWMPDASTYVIKLLEVAPETASMPPSAEVVGAGICALGIVPDQVIANVPLVVIVDGVTDKPVGTVTPMLVTVPEPPPPEPHEVQPAPFALHLMPPPFAIVSIPMPDWPAVSVGNAFVLIVQIITLGSVVSFNFKEPESFSVATLVPLHVPSLFVVPAQALMKFKPEATAAAESRLTRLLLLPPVVLVCSTVKLLRALLLSIIRNLLYAPVAPAPPDGCAR